MRKTLAIAALAGSMAVTGLALSPAAQATATQTAAAPQPATTTVSAQSLGRWGKFYSSDRKAYTYGKTWKSAGKVYTKWYGVEKPGGKKGWVWFQYYKGGSWHKFNKAWDGKISHTWAGKGLKKVYTYTCWGGASLNCGKKYRIY